MGTRFPVDIYATAPQSADVAADAYLDETDRVARWSEEAGCRGILIYTYNRLIDPWLVADQVIRSTTALKPLVATQPVYMHPYSVATMIASLGYLHGRGISLNMVAGGFKKDLEALGDVTPHDRRYDRLVEYVSIVLGLLRGESVTLGGEFYDVKALSLSPRLDPDLMPTVLLSGSSDAGRAAARALGATAVEYPRPGHEYGDRDSDGAGGAGIRIGIVTAETEDAAWELAHERFPPDRRGQLTHQMAMKVSDSEWHRQLSEMSTGEARSTYWLWPFENYRTFCPYLVGSHDTVAKELAVYLDAGFRTFILDIPATERDLEQAGIVFRRALERAAP